MGLWDFSQDHYKSDGDINKELKEGIQFQGKNKFFIMGLIDGTFA